MLRGGRLDVPIMAGTYKIADLNRHVIRRDRLMVALPVKHPLTAQSDVEWRQLAEQTILVRMDRTDPRVHNLIVTSPAGTWQPRQSFVLIRV
ncbi:LysR substrate-binding domain-containing protein [Brucella cytisi]|uniref:LysR substrate-binding domain-containing protein n=1 Tax=Brucella cytisi TaxID=407152 RepID=UPI0035E3AD81